MKQGDLTKDGVDGVHGDLVLSGISDESFGIGEGDIRGCGTVALIVGDDFDAVVLPDSDAGVGGAQVDSDGESLSFSGHFFLEGKIAKNLNLGFLVQFSVNEWKEEK